MPLVVDRNVDVAVIVEIAQLCFEGEAIADHRTKPCRDRLAAARRLAAECEARAALEQAPAAPVEAAG